MKLYEIPLAIRNALDGMIVDEDTGEILNAPDLAIVEGEAKEKVENAGLYVRELEADAKALKDEIDRMKARHDAIVKKVDSIKSLIEPALDALDGKVKGTRLTVYFRKSEKIVIDVDPSTLPEVYKKVVISADKTGIKKALKSGESINGCSLEDSRSVCFR